MGIEAQKWAKFQEKKKNKSQVHSENNLKKFSSLYFLEQIGIKTKRVENLLFLVKKVCGSFNPVN